MMEQLSVLEFAGPRWCASIRLVLMTEPLIVASRAVSSCLGYPEISSGSLAATLCTVPAIGRFFPLPCGDPGGSKFHVTVD